MCELCIIKEKTSEQEELNVYKTRFYYVELTGGPIGEKIIHSTLSTTEPLTDEERHRIGISRILLMAHAEKRNILSNYIYITEEEALFQFERGFNAKRNLSTHLSIMRKSIMYFMAFLLFYLGAIVTDDPALIMSVLILFIPGAYGAALLSTRKENQLLKKK